jgi:hypothetical protein
MLERLATPIILEYVGMGGKDTLFLELTRYDQAAATYYTESGMSATKRYVEAIARGEFPWLRVRKQDTNGAGRR